MEMTTEEFEKQLEKVKSDTYKFYLDTYTCRMTRKKAQGTWTEQDDIEYQKQYEYCQNIINNFISSITIVDKEVNNGKQ